MKEKSQYKIYIDTSDRSSTKIILFQIDGNTETEIYKKEGQGDVVCSIQEMLKNMHLSIEDMKEVAYNRGPGSFTGLRTGATISNVLNWVLGKKVVKDLEYPEYGAEPNITPPKKFKI